MLLHASDNDSMASWVIVVACPDWYFGNNPALTCLLPPGAAQVLREKRLPKVSPDCLLSVGSDPGRKASDTLESVTAALVSDERQDLVLTQLSEIAASDALISRFQAPLTPETIQAYRKSCKQVLHRHGLPSRHVGILLQRSRRSLAGDAQLRVSSLLLSCCGPRSNSPAGVALSMANIKAVQLAGEEAVDSIRSSLRAALLAARSFAAKGAFGGDQATWEAYGNASTFQTTVEAQATEPMEPTGVATATELAPMSHLPDGSLDWSRGRRSVIGLLREIAHA